MTDDMVVVSVEVVTSDPEQVTRSIEAFARAAAGLALEGIAVSVNASTPTEDDDE